MKTSMRTALCMFVLMANVALADQPTQQKPYPDEAQLAEHGHYTNKRGKAVHAPAHSKSGAAPDGATAKCSDGTYSFSQSHRGTCSRHGGVGQWL